MVKLVNDIEQLVRQLCNAMVVPEIALIHLDSIMASILQILSERVEDIGELAEKYSEYKSAGKTNIYSLKNWLPSFACYATNSLFGKLTEAIWISLKGSAIRCGQLHEAFKNH